MLTGRQALGPFGRRLEAHRPHQTQARRALKKAGNCRPVPRHALLKPSPTVLCLQPSAPLFNALWRSRRRSTERTGCVGLWKLGKFCGLRIVPEQFGRRTRAREACFGARRGIDMHLGAASKFQSLLRSFHIIYCKKQDIP